MFLFFISPIISTWIPDQEFADIYVILSQNIITTRPSPQPTQPKVHITNSIFTECFIKNSKGGAIFYEFEDGQILIEFSSFINCYAFSNGGAIFTSECDCILYCVCGNGCYTTYYSAAGQFTQSTSSSDKQKLNCINSSSVCHTAPPVYGYYTIMLSNSKQICSSVNVSDNSVESNSAINFKSGSDTSYIRYCSINSNYAIYNYCIYLDGQGDGTKYEIEACNIINNEQDSTSPMLFFGKNTEMKECCIFNNKVRNNNSGFKLFGINTDCTLTLIHCHCQEYSISGSGMVEKSNNPTTQFINDLKLTETENGCYSGIEQVGDLTPFTKTDSWQNACKCSNKQHPYLIMKKYIILVLFNSLL